MSHRKNISISSSQAFHFPSSSTVAQIAIRNNRFFFLLFSSSSSSSVIHFIPFRWNSLSYSAQIICHACRIAHCIRLQSSHETIRFSSLHRTLSNLLYLTSAQRIFIFMFEQMCEDKSFAEYIYMSSLFHVHVYHSCVWTFLYSFSSPHLIRWMAARWCFTFLRMIKEQGEKIISVVKPFEMSE